MPIPKVKVAFKLIIKMERIVEEAGKETREDEFDYGCASLESYHEAEVKFHQLLDVLKVK